MEPHCFTLAVEPVTPELLKREEKVRQEKKQEPTSEDNHLTSTPNPTAVDKGPLHSVQNGMVEKRTSKVAHNSNPETALVRLSSGKIVRISMDFLRQHQLQQKAQNAPPVVPNGSSGARLSQILNGLKPQQPQTATLSQSHPQVVVKEKQQQEALLSLLKSGRLPPVPNTLGGHPTRIVKIRANPGLVANGAVITTASKLSDKLSSIVATTATPGSPIRAISRDSVLPSGAVPIRCIAGATQISNGQKVSVPIGQIPVMTGNPTPSTFQAVTSNLSPSKQSQGIIVLNKTNAIPNAGGKLQLSPLIAKKTVLATSSVQGSVPQGAILVQRDQQSGQLKVVVPNSTTNPVVLPPGVVKLNSQKNSPAKTTEG